MNGAESFFYYFGWCIVISLIVYLVITIYIGRTQSKTQKLYYGKLVFTVGLLFIGLSFIIQNRGLLTFFLLGFGLITEFIGIFIILASRTR